MKIVSQNPWEYFLTFGSLVTRDWLSKSAYITVEEVAHGIEGQLLRFLKLLLRDTNFLICYSRS